MQSDSYATVRRSSEEGGKFIISLALSVGVYALRRGSMLRSSLNGMPLHVRPSARVALGAASLN